MTDQSQLFNVVHQTQVSSLESYWDSEVDLWFQEPNKEDLEPCSLSPFNETRACSSSGSESLSDPSEPDHQLNEDSEPASPEREEAKLQECLPLSDTRSVLTYPVFENENVGRQIWQTTMSYLAQLSSQAPPTSPQSLLGFIGSLIPQVQATEDLASGQFVLMMHALRVAATKEEEENRVEEQRVQANREERLRSGKKTNKMHLKTFHLKSKLAPRKSCKSLAKVHAKTGRKPQAYPCFFCHTICPYRVSLIKHFQEVHHLNRSQSLLYKRIRQGPECIKRLYNLD